MTSLLETPRLVLRKVVAGDAAFILELMNEHAYILNIGDRGVRTVDDAIDYIDAKYTTSYERLGFGLYLVELKAGRVPIGICGFVKREVLEHPDLGFAYLEKFWSQGYGYESSAGVLGYGRQTLKLSRIFGLTSPANHRSIHLLEKLGFAYDQSLSLPGYARESLLFSMDLKPA